MKGSLVAAVLIGAVVFAAGAATARGATTQCIPPVGPGDSSRHSVDLRVAYVSCSTGRRVALRCARYSYGHVGTCLAALSRWRCTSTKATGSQSTETCVAGRQFVRITWTD